MLLAISSKSIVKVYLVNYSESWCLIKLATNILHYRIITLLGISSKSIVKVDIVNYSEVNVQLNQWLICSQCDY